MKQENVGLITFQIEYSIFIFSSSTAEDLFPTYFQVDWLEILAHFHKLHEILK
jgi:hypothetical protein